MTGGDSLVDMTWWQMTWWQMTTVQKMALTTLPIGKLLPVIISNYDEQYQKNLKNAALMQDCNTLTVCTPVQLLGDDLPVQLNFRAPRY